MEKIKDKNYVKSEMFEIEPQDINEGFWENALLVAGFIPVIGEVADTILIIKYWREGRKIEAGLMLLALIPTVGDIIVKPFLRLGKAAGAFKTATTFTKFIAENPQARAAYAKIGKQMDNPAINKLVAQVGKKTPQGAEALTGAIAYQKSLFSKVGSTVSDASAKVGSTLERGLGKTMKQTFQDKALQKYLIKTGGVAPSNFLSRWWNVVYKGRLDRKNAVRKLIFGSNLLGALGFPNIESLERAMADPKQADELMKNPQFAQFYNQATTPEEQQSMAQPEPEKESGIGNLLGGAGSFVGLNVLKSLARFV
jgi:hypothetical protein